MGLNITTLSVKIDKLDRRERVEVAKAVADGRPTPRVNWGGDAKVHHPWEETEFNNRHLRTDADYAFFSKLISNLEIPNVSIVSDYPVFSESDRVIRLSRQSVDYVVSRAARFVGHETKIIVIGGWTFYLDTALRLGWLYDLVAKARKKRKFPPLR